MNDASPPFSLTIFLTSTSMLANFMLPSSLYVISSLLFAAAGGAISSRLGAGIAGWGGVGSVTSSRLGAGSEGCGGVIEGDSGNVAVVASGDGAVNLLSLLITKLFFDLGRTKDTRVPAGLASEQPNFSINCVSCASSTSVMLINAPFLLCRNFDRFAGMAAGSDKSDVGGSGGDDDGIGIGISCSCSDSNEGADVNGRGAAVDVDDVNESSPTADSTVIASVEATTEEEEESVRGCIFSIFSIFGESIFSLFSVRFGGCGGHGAGIFGRGFCGAGGAFLVCVSFRSVSGAVGISAVAAAVLSVLCGVCENGGSGATSFPAEWDLRCEYDTSLRVGRRTDVLIVNFCCVPIALLVLCVTANGIFSFVVGPPLPLPPLLLFAAVIFCGVFIVICISDFCVCSV